LNSFGTLVQQRRPCQLNRNRRLEMFDALGTPC
jgi:hypothetical protein